MIEFREDGGTRATALRDELRDRITVFDARMKMVGRVIEKFVELEGVYSPMKMFWDSRIDICESALSVVRNQLKDGTEILASWRKGMVEVELEDEYGTLYVDEVLGLTEYPLGDFKFTDPTLDDWARFNGFIKWERKVNKLEMCLGKITHGLEIMDTLEGKATEMVLQLLGVADDGNPEGYSLESLERIHERPYKEVETFNKMLMDAEKDRANRRVKAIAKRTDR